MNKSSLMEVVSDPEFKTLSHEDRLAVIGSVDPEFNSLSHEDQEAVLSNLLGEPAGTPEDTQHHYTLGEVPGAAAQNFIPSAGKFLGGIWDAVVDPVGTVKGVNNIVNGAALNAGDAILPGSKEAWLGIHPEDKGQVEAADAVGQMYAHRYGGFQNILDTMAEDPVGFTTDASTVLAPAAGPLRAAIPARVPQVAVDAAAIVANPARAMEGPVQAAGRGVRGVVNALDPQSNLMERVAEGREQELINAMNHPIEHVPGAPLTARQVAADLPDTPNNFQALGLDAEALRSTQTTGIENAANDARLAQVRQVGTTHALTPDQILRAGLGPVNPDQIAHMTIQELEAARGAANAHNYAPIDPRLIPEDSAFHDLVNRVPNDAVMQTAREIAQIEGRPLEAIPGVPPTPATTAHSGLFDAHGRPIMHTTPADPGTPAQYRGEDLIRIKKAFDRLASSRELRAKYSIDDEAARALGGARAAYVRWLEDPTRLPEHAQAAADHAAWSRLIDRKHARNVFEDALTGPLHGEDQLVQRANIFANLFDSPRNAVTGNSAVRKATTFDAYDHWSDLLTPEELRALEGVRDDLARAKKSDTLARKPNVTKGALNSAAEPPQAPGFLNKGMTILNALSRGATGHVNQRVANALADAMMTPRGAAAALQRTIDRAETWNRRSEPVRRIGRAAQRVNRVPAVYNALAEKHRRDIEAENKRLLDSL